MERNLPRRELEDYEADPRLSRILDEHLPGREQYLDYTTEDLADITDEDIDLLKIYYSEHPEDFPSGEYIDVRDWDSWRDVSIKYNDEKKKWIVSYKWFSDDTTIDDEFNTEQRATDFITEHRQYNRKTALYLIKLARDYGKNNIKDKLAQSTPEPTLETLDKGEGKQITKKSSSSTTETPELSPEQQARIYEYQYPTRKANENDYFRGYTLPEWLHIDVDSEEHNKLKEAIKELGLMPKLVELDAIIKAQHQSNEISGNYLTFINATRELYGLNPLQTTPKVEELQDSLPDDSGGESTPVESANGTQATVDEKRQEPITDNNMNNEALSNLNTSETLQTFGRLPDTNTEEESIIEGRAKRRSSSADVGDMSPDAEAEPTTSEPEVLVSEDSGPQSSTEPNPDSIASFPEDSQQPPEAEVTDQTNPDLDELQPELSRLVTEAAIELPKEQGGAIVRASDEASKPFEPNLDALYQQLSSHNINLSEPGKLARVESDTYPGEVELETIYNSIEINSVKEKALEAISDYQQFIEINRNNLRDEKIYNEYSIIEKKAWFHVGRFIHKLGGEIATLPQERDIQLAHPEVVDIKEYLVNGEKITLDEEDNITHLNIDGNIIELNKPRTIEELLKAKRPTHILYHSGTPISENDPTKQNYRGLLIDGLNEDTLALIEGVLNKKETVIVDETGLPFSDNSFKELVRQTPDEVVEELEPTSPNLDKDAIIKEYRQIGFSEEQLEYIGKAIDAGDSQDMIYKYAKPGYNLAQMYIERAKLSNPNLDISKYESLSHDIQTWVIEGMRIGHTEEQIALYAKNWVGGDEIKSIFEDISNGLNVEEILKNQLHIRTTKYLTLLPGGISKSFLMGKLKSEGFIEEQVVTTIDSLSVDWNAQALKEAQMYMNISDKTFSKDELKQKLQSSFFTEDEANYAVDNLNIDWSTRGAQQVVDKEPESNNQSEIRETTPQVSLEDLRLAYARAEETWNRKRGDEYLEDAFIEARDAYNTELEKVLKLQVAQEQEANIHELFKNEVISLREQRITQSKELQGTWEKRFNNTKEKLLGWATKNKTRWMLANIGLLATGGLLSLTGVGIPVAGALEGTRRALGSVMSGVSANNTLVGLMEDRDTNINIFGKNIKFQAVIPKLVKESLSTNEDDFKKVSDDVLKDRLGTLEAYYRLNGGKFTNDDQQKAYEKILIELGHRVRVNTLENYQNTQESSSEQTQDISANQDGLQESVDTSSQDNNSTEVVNSSNTETFNFGESRYTSELLNIISDKRVQELDKFRRNRKIAAVAGVATTGILGSLLVNDMHRPGSMFNPNDNPDTVTSVPKTEPGSGTGGANTGESVTPKPTTEPISPNPSETPGTRGLGEPPSAPEAQPTGAGEALSQSEQLAQDVSNLTPRESIWTEVAKQLKGATDTQIQQAVENLLQSAEGQNSIYKLAQGTEGGRALLSQWGIDNASEMAILSKEQLYEISRYLAPGELQGITELSLENLTPFETVEATQVDVSEAMDNSTPATEASAPSVEPTLSAAPEATDSPEVTAPTEPTAFTQELSEILGKSNLTEIQARDMIQNYFLDDYGREAIYKSLAKTPEGAQFLSQGFGVNNSLDFANLAPDKMYEISQSIKPTDLEKIINESILSKFEMADVVSLVEGDSPLGAVNRYIASEVGNLPYDSTLGQQVLNAYINTPEGKEWLYESIVSNPNPNNQNVQMFREYLRFEGIQSVEDFKQKFDWVKFSGNRRIPTSGFWNYTRLPNGNMRIAPLSTFLQPGKMVGIPEAIRQVLIKQ